MILVKIINIIITHVRMYTVYQEVIVVSCGHIHVVQKNYFIALIKYIWQTELLNKFSIN